MRAARKRATRRLRFRHTAKPTDPRPRLLIVLVVFLTVGAGFVAQLVDLQATQSDRSEELRLRGEAQRTKTRELTGSRGSVLDRNGFVLATSTATHEVVADPTLIDDPDATARLLAPILNLDVSFLARELRGESEGDRWALLTGSLSTDGVEQIKDLRDDDHHSALLVGIYLEPREARVYPAGGLATPVVGRVDPDDQGIYGIEAQYNEAMSGVPGQMEFEASRFGSISVADWKIDPAVEGYDVRLTLDHRLQFVAEEALRAQCEATGASGATAVATDPRTGEILAMAGVARNDEGVCVVPRHNSALVWAFEPGSVIKTITMAAAVEELGWTSQTRVDVPPQVVVGDKTFVDHPPHPTAPYPLGQILADSMNVGTIEVARAVGPAQVHAYLERFGLGRTTGIGFKGETPGSVRALDDWWGSDAGSIPIGQGVTVNATQLAAAYNVIASRGMYRSPVLVRSIESPDGTVYAPDPGPGRPVLSERTTNELRAMLTQVVAEGTGRRAAIDGYAVAGKTGTAWKVFENGDGDYTYGSNGDRRYVSTFAGFAPADAPRISIVVVIDEPTIGSTTASAVAAPVFAEIGDYALRALEVTPSTVIGLDVDPVAPVRAEPAAAPSDPGSTPAPSESTDTVAALESEPPNQTDSSDDPAEALTTPEGSRRNETGTG